MGQYIFGLSNDIRSGTLWLGLIFTMWFIDPYLSWIEDNLLSYLLYFMALTMHTEKYAWELSYSLEMRRCGKLWRLAEISQRKRRLIRMMWRSKWRTLTAEHWMSFSMWSLMRNSRRYSLLILQRKYEPSSRQPTKGPRLSRTQNSKGSPLALRR